MITAAKGKIDSFYMIISLYNVKKVSNLYLWKKNESLINL